MSSLVSAMTMPRCPCAFVDLKVPDKLYRDVIRLPETALYGGDRVYAVVEDRLSECKVDVIAYEGSNVIVRGDIADGDTVLATQISGIGNGLLVREEGAPPLRPRPAVRDL
ncbi:hypothetical protein [Breoghania sp.]|uniref:hypothetical protein n=1 Tax=Breoghania sp. TaxID=2065378 RepID=UPI002606D389|nr:hypothetical protein [Breoghania sp.]